MISPNLWTVPLDLALFCRPWRRKANKWVVKDAKDARQLYFSEPEHYSKEFWFLWNEFRASIAEHYSFTQLKIPLKVGAQQKIKQKSYPLERS